MQLLEQREHELDEKTASLVQLAQEREQTETSMTAANASLSEAQALLQADRERMASLEQLLEQREHELDEKTASLVQLAQEREQTETSMAAANASLSEAQALLQADRERMASLEQLLEQREHELDEKTASLVQLAQEREQTETSTAAANASLSEAQALLQADRERMASLEQLLEQREHELDEKTASLVQLAQEREQTETSMAAANASLSEAQALLQADRERMASLEQLLELREAELEHTTALEQELHSLRAHVLELEALETRRAVTPLQPRSHLRLVALPTGYALSETPEPPPQVGELIGIDGKRYAVASSGRSPLPGDERPCVLLLAEPSGTNRASIARGFRACSRPSRVALALRSHIECDTGRRRFCPEVNVAASRADKHERYGETKRHAEWRFANDARGEARNVQRACSSSARGADDA